MNRLTHRQGPNKKDWKIEGQKFAEWEGHSNGQCIWVDFSCVKAANEGVKACKMPRAKRHNPSTMFKYNEKCVYKLTTLL